MWTHCWAASSRSSPLVKWPPVMTWRVRMEKTTSSGLAQEACSGVNSTCTCGCWSIQRVVWALVWVDPLSMMIVTSCPSAARSSRTVVKAAESIRVWARRSAIVPVPASWVPYQASVPARWYSKLPPPTPARAVGVRMAWGAYRQRGLLIQAEHGALPATGDRDRGLDRGDALLELRVGLAMQPAAHPVHADVRLAQHPPHPRPAPRCRTPRCSGRGPVRRIEECRGQAVDVRGQSGVRPRSPWPRRISGGHCGDGPALLVTVSPRSPDRGRSRSPGSPRAR